MLIDMIEAATRSDLLTSPVVNLATEAENVVMNTLAFGLHSTFALSPEVRVPIVSIDPYPHHVVAGVQLLRIATARDLERGKISRESFASLGETLEETLRALPQSSKAVRAARNN
jgi:hypothetical protein